jgi:hypothetical protein
MGMMTGKGGGKKALASKPNLLNALRVQTSAYGQVIPVVYGQNRISGRLIWSGDFTAIPHTSTQKTGGKGLGTGGGNAITNTTYTYQTAVAIALCQGPIQNLHNVWDSKGRLTLLTTSAQFAVPGGGGTFMPPGDGRIFHSGHGVTRQDAFSIQASDYGSDGTITLSGNQQSPMTLVASSPAAAGEYSLDTSTGTHTFSAGDAGKTMTINYSYSFPDSNSNGQPQQKLSLTLFLGERPQTPWTYLTSKHAGKDLGYNGVAYVASSNMDLGESGTLPNLSFEVLGILPFGSGITDAEPSSIIADLLSNPFYGMAGAVPLDNQRAGNTLAQYRNFCVANGIFLSPVLDAQRAASDWVQEILDVTNAAAVWSEGLLKIVSYGDTTAVGNGAIFSPSTSPIYDLTSADFLAPVTVKRPSIADVNNAVSVEFVNRANDYNPDVAEDKDEAMIGLFGLRKAEPKQAHSITTASVARFAANLLRKRQVEIRATYTLKLGWQFNLLEPMDLVTITVPELGYNKKPVRITAIREDDSGQLELDAEDFPFGTATPTLYPHQTPGGFVPQANADPGPVNVPIIFEANDRLSLTGNYEVWIGVSGGSIANLLTFSEQFDNAAWVRNSSGVAQATVTANNQTDPLSGTTADTVSFPATAAGQWALLQQTFLDIATVAGKTYTLSIWLKAASSTTIVLILEDSGGHHAASQFVNVTTAWTRFSITGTFPAGGLTGTPLVLFGNNGSAAAATVFAWGAQLEQASAPSDYLKTTALPGMRSNPDWGGCSVWVSPDNANYSMAGKIFGPARMGVLTAQLAFASDPDATDTLPVDLSQSSGALLSGTQSDCDNFRTLCFVDDELISYENATLTSAFHYDLGASGSPIAITAASNTSPIQITAANHGYVTGQTITISGVGGNTAANGTWTITVIDANTFSLNASTGNGAYTSSGTAVRAPRLRRGVFGSPIGTHNAGSVFLRLDDAVFVWEADPTLVGTTIFFKFTSFNQFGLMEQSLANAAAYPFVFNGLFGNHDESPANNATIDSVFTGGTADNIRIYGPGGAGTSYSAWKQKDQSGARTMPAQTITVVEETGAAPQVSTFYWISYDFQAATHRAWANYNDYVQAIYRGQMRVGSLKTVDSSGTGGTTGGFGSSGSGGSGDPSRPLAQL